MFERDWNKYIVLKMDDATKYLSKEEVACLSAYCKKIFYGRYRDNKRTTSYAVVKDTLPFYNQVWGMIEDYAASTNTKHTSN